MGTVLKGFSLVLFSLLLCSSLSVAEAKTVFSSKRESSEFVKTENKNTLEGQYSGASSDGKAGAPGASGSPGNLGASGASGTLGNGTGQLDPSTITKTEYDAYLGASSDFAKMEKKLIKAYNNCLDDIGPGPEAWLKIRQVEWAKMREQHAYKTCSPKGGPAYLKVLSDEAKKRIDWLDSLADKGKVVYAHDYTYGKPGNAGVLTVIYRKKGAEIALYTKKIGLGAGGLKAESSLNESWNCSAYGFTQFSGGKAVLKTSGGTVTLDMIELGKSINITSQPANNICSGGGEVDGSYELTN